MDVRVIVATHRNLDELVKKGAFRQDLYHRIYVFPLLLPPLRERADDIPALVAHFARRWRSRTAGSRSRSRRRRSRSCSATRGPATCANCATWWSGCCCWRTDAVDVGAVRLALPPGTAAGRRRRRRRKRGTLAERADAFEREQILAELKRHNQRMTDTAKALGLERSHLYKKCQELGVDLQALKTDIGG